MTPPIRTIILDDEPHSANALLLLLRKHCPEVQVLAAVNDSEAGLELIRQHRPDLVFLDIEMPRLNGFQVVEALGNQRFMLIFTTAYDRYAVRAFKYSALDYLLKPIDPEELTKAVGRAKERHGELQKQLEVFQHNVQYPQLLGKIALPHQHGFLFVEISSIILVESDGNYSLIHIEGEKPVLVTKPIGDVEEVLDHQLFFRVHRKYLIQLAFIREYVRSDGGFVIMKNGMNIPIARSRKEEFGQLFLRL